MSEVTTNVRTVCRDLVAEQDALDLIVSELKPEEFAAQTPSPRWTIADQIGHLTYFDRTAALAIDDEDGFRAHVAELVPALTSDEDDAMDRITLGEFRSATPEELVAAWRRGRIALARAAKGLADDARVAWYGPSMGAKSFLTARLMETWAHGQDIADTVNAERASTDRIRHIAQLGFITHQWSYVNRGLVAPTAPVHVSLNAPSGDIWNFGPADAGNRIAGPATDFCLVVTQRRHIDDTELIVTGKSARDWMVQAQAFAGAPTNGPAAGSH